MKPARITGTFRVEEAPGVHRHGRACVRLLEPLEYRVGSENSDERIVVPAGATTDFASIPWGLRNTFPPLGAWARPAIIHDFLYETRGSGVLDGVRWISRPVDYTRADADAIFLEAMEVVGVPTWRRTVMYRAVRLGGGGGWGR
jgi:hypothetical protein